MNIYEIEANELDTCLSLLNKVFSPSEIRDDKTNRKLFESKDIQISCIKENDEIVTCIIYWNTKDYLFLENFATKKEYRNKGLGSKLIKHLQHLNKPMILEVELPTNDMSYKRIKFYERCGLKYNEDEYYLPPLRENGETEKMSLMTYNKHVDKELIHDIYKNIYRTNKTIDDYRKMFEQQIANKKNK